jgi:hypothetical protein
MTKNIVINDKGDTIPVTVSEEDEVFYIDIDGVEWCSTENQVHATVLFNMICDHITEYMHYEKV